MNSIKDILTEFSHRVRRGTARFPLSVLFAAALAVVAIVLNHIDCSNISDSTEFFLYWYPITAIMLSTALSLWYEQHHSRKSLTVYVIAEAIWPGIMAIVSRNASNIAYAPGRYIMMGIVVLLVTAMIVLPFLGRKSGDVPFWNFTVRSIFAVAAAFVIAGILCGGLCLLLMSFDRLFGLDVSNSLYADIAYVCFLFIAPVLTFQGIPDGQRKYDAVPMKVPGLLAMACRYLFVPLTAAYIVTLYVYALRILFTLVLPRGWVSWPVSFSMFAVTGLFLLAYPFLRNSDDPLPQEEGTRVSRRLTLLITRIFPLLMLPLLVLMSIGIARRISEYGISILRIYLIFFNLWSYAACAAMAFARKRRVMWIPLSAVLLFALLSVFPVNISTFVRERMSAQLNEILDSSSWDGKPMDDDGYRNWLLSLDNETAKKADSRLDYLKREFSRSQTDSIVNSDVWLGRLANSRSEEAEKASDDSKTLNLYCNGTLPDSIISIPEGAAGFKMIDFSNEVKITDITDDTLHFYVPTDYASFSTPVEFEIPLNRWRELSEKGYPYDIRPSDPLSYTDVTGKYVLIVSNFYLYAGTEGGNCNIHGLFFNLNK